MALGDFRSVFMPYCLKKQQDGRHVVLNREYKPVGFATKEHVTYEDFPVAVKFKRLTSITARKLSCDDNADVDTIYLYNDRTNPINSRENMTAYLVKLETLAKLQLQIGH